MPNANFFARFGLYVRPAFLDRAECAGLIAAARASRSEPATVYTGDDYGLDEDVRRTRWCAIDDAYLAPYRARMHGLLPDLSAHFAAPLRGLQRPQMLRYAVGDFFVPHADSHARVGSARKVSSIVFLNDDHALPEEGGYRGGALSFYGLLGDVGGGVGLPIQAEAGMLIAFPAHLTHGVSVITAGERFSLITWLALEPDDGRPTAD